MQIATRNIEKITQSGMLRANSLSISEKSIQPFSSSLISRMVALFFS